jgi:hypothetical protein
MNVDLKSGSHLIAVFLSINPIDNQRINYNSWLSNKYSFSEHSLQIGLGISNFGKEFRF